MANNIDSVEEAKRIVRASTEARVTLRLMGGLAIRFHCHGPHSEHLRAYHDIDLLGLNKEFKGINSVFQKLGYSPNPLYNAIYSATRLQFINQRSGGHVDIFFDKIRMEHTLDFRDRLHLDNMTIPVTDLLLSKLTIVKLTEKDGKDIVAILEDHEIGYSDGQEILNLNYLTSLCSDQWGLHKTVTDNLGKMTQFIQQQVSDINKKKELFDKLEAIQNAIKLSKKTTRWRLRSLIGEKVRWYDVVETGEGEAQ